MIGQGNSVSHGVVLKHYFVDQADNDFQPEVFRIRGTATPDDYDKSFDEILFSGMLSKGDKSAYHLIINPSTKEKELTYDQWHTAIDEYLEQLGFEKQKHLAVMHTKFGRAHMHVLVDRYDYDLEKLLSDSNNYYKHQTASTNLEDMFGHERTPRKTDYSKLAHHKDLITDIWHNTHDGDSFLATLQDAGYHVGRGRGNHPLRVVSENSAKKKSLDLVRQIKGVPAKEVYDRLKEIELQSEAEALKQIPEHKIVASELATEKFISNLKDENLIADQEDREREKKHTSRVEAEISSLETQLEVEKKEIDKNKEVEDLFQMMLKKQQELKEKLEQKRRDLDQGMSM